MRKTKINGLVLAFLVVIIFLIFLLCIQFYMINDIKKAYTTLNKENNQLQNSYVKTQKELANTKAKIEVENK